MKVNLKDNIWIEGFDIGFDKSSQILPIGVATIYQGETSKIPINIAKEYFDYGYDDLEIIYTSLDESIKSTCDKEYCVIYKTN